MKQTNFLKLAKEIARILFSKKADNVTIIDVRKITTLTEFFVIASGSSDTHLRTLYETLEEELKLQNLPLLQREVNRSSLWQVLDYGGIIVHLFHPDVRDFYQLERLWNDGKKVVWQTKKKDIRKKTNSKR